MRLVLSYILIGGSFGMVAGQAQPALVTFYSPGCGSCLRDFVFDTLAGSSVTPYSGAIYDGQTKLIETITPNRFVTIRIQPGIHTFAGEKMGVFSLKRKRANKQDLQLMIQPGRHYFVGLLSKDTGMTYWFRQFSPILASRDCQQAFKEASQTEPLQPGRIGGKRMADVEPTVYFPACGANDKLPD